MSELGLRSNLEVVSHEEDLEIIPSSKRVKKIVSDETSSEGSSEINEENNSKLVRMAGAIKTILEVI